MRLYVSQILQDNAEVITDGVTNQSIAVLRQGQFAQVAALPTEEQAAKLAALIKANVAVYEPAPAEEEYQPLPSNSTVLHDSLVNSTA